MVSRRAESKAVLVVNLHGPNEPSIKFFNFTISPTPHRALVCPKHSSKLPHKSDFTLMFYGLYVCVSLEPGSPRGRSNLGEHLPVHCKVSFWGNIKGEYPACACYSQSYSVGGSSDAAFRCRYCSNLLSLLLCPVRVRNIANTMPVCLSCVCLSVCPRA